MNPLRLGFILILCMALAGCASMISSATRGLADNLSQAILNQNDPQTVRDGAPAYLIMIDSLVAGDQDNVDMLRAAARLYGSYASAFVDDEERAALLASKSLDYARRALCLELEYLCPAMTVKLEDLQAELARVKQGGQPVLYDFASSWAGWIQANSGDWNALAQIPRLQAMFQRSLELDETYDRGGAHLYLGVLASQIPPALGGKPEVGRSHFEQALQLSGRHSKMVYVLYAEHYARLVFDQELHDRLLREALAEVDDSEGLVLMNTLARQRAKQLLMESEEFF